jgi:caffeoyl-CoA O-methyltransferase
MRYITDPEIEAYATEHSSPEPGLLQELAAATHQLSDSPQMMVGPLEGQLLKMLVAASGARRVLEIGTFTGYSALSMAEALPPDGRLLTCELDERHAAIAQGVFDRSPLGALIELRRGRAIDTLAGLEGPFDFCFIDADKEGYVDYYEAVLPKLAPGGLIAVDNVLASGRVLEKGDTSEYAVAIRTFNEHVRKDSRVQCVMLPVRDGVTLIRKV